MKEPRSAKPMHFRGIMRPRSGIVRGSIPQGSLETVTKVARISEITKVPLRSAAPLVLALCQIPVMGCASGVARDYERGDSRGEQGFFTFVMLWSKGMRIARDFFAGEF